MPTSWARPLSGLLYLYSGNGAGGWLRQTLIGSGWNGMSSIKAAGDLNGDGVPDILGTTSSGMSSYLGTVWAVGSDRS